MLCVENLYAEVNMYVTLWSMIMMIVQKQVMERGVAETDTIPSITRHRDIKMILKLLFELN